MAVPLCLFLLVFAYFDPSSGKEPCDATMDVYVAPWGSVLLQLTDSERTHCPGDCSFVWRVNETRPVVTVKPSTSSSTLCKRNMPKCQAFANGSLELSLVTPQEAGLYHVVMEEGGKGKYRKCFPLQLQDPVSPPDVSYACLPNSRVQLSCLVKKDSNPSYCWSMGGTPCWKNMSVIETQYESVLRSVTCTAKNQISEKQSQPTDVTCPDPVSEPEVESMCGPDGTVQLICRVKNGTHLSYSWNVAGVPGNTSSEKITWQGPLLINVTCTARNQISEETSQTRNISCIDPVSEPEVESICGPDGTVQLICRVKNGTHLSYSWNVAGVPGNTSSEKITWQGPLLINVTCTARNQISEETSQTRNISCIDPVSEPEVGSMCGSNGTVQLICHVKNGTHLSYSWSVAGVLVNTSFEKITWQGPLLTNVTCTTRNQISEETSQPRNISCIDPVSEPKVGFSCVSNNTIRLVCLVTKGTDPHSRPSYSWTINGAQNGSSPAGEITVHGTALINVTCTAKNLISERESNPINATCVAFRGPCLINMVRGLADIEEVFLVLGKNALPDTAASCGLLSEGRGS
ncbi:uncharacterized protein [Ambystoma mexicanum]|uniref:uncharacterized protein isoform X2 n=1 Tax=Ambystoma mexicanum TaxID=8296 RepID=UPI0037E6FD7E